MRQVKEILVAIDKSAMTKEVLKRAILIAKKKDAQLMIIYVIETSLLSLPFLNTVDENELKKDITWQIDELNKEAGVAYHLFIEYGIPSQVIAYKVKKIKSDLLIVGSHGKDDINNKHFGSTTLNLIQDTHIPVLIVKIEVKNIYQNMLAPTNLSDYSKESILFANELFTKPSLKYLYAFENISELQAMTYRIDDKEWKNAQKSLKNDAKIELEKFVKDVGGGEMALIDFRASINEDLLAYIEGDRADLLVLGSKGVDNLNSFVFGSTASFLVKKSPIDVLVYVPKYTHSKSS
jgi:nucleotide-binding universal stress UspA family protein